MQLDLPATRESLEPARLAVGEYLAASSPSAALTYQVELVLEEILMNIVWHAYPPGGEHRMRLAVQVRDDEVELDFEDDGVAFDPVSAAAPVLPASLDEAKAGGLGVLLVKKFARRLHYERAGGCNRLQVVLAR